MSRPSPIPPVLDTPPSLDDDEVAALLQRALFHWYESRLGQGHRFGTRPQPYRLFPRVYAALDPGAAITARDPGDGRLLGICFTHPRETHHAIGIVATHPDAAGRGVARSMMTNAIQRARDDGGKPVRLVSSLWNLDSFSLYTRLGFTPGAIYQDLLIDVPPDGPPGPPPGQAALVRHARPGEAAAIATFENQLQGVSRPQDYAFFLENRVGDWRLRVCEDTNGKLTGVLAASVHPDAAMTGPGCATGREAALALLWHTLHDFAGRAVLVLAPASDAPLIAALYRLGARNVELHAAQCLGTPQPASGLAFPTFLPESA